MQCHHVHEQLTRKANISTEMDLPGLVALTTLGETTIISVKQKVNTLDSVV